jgi:CheY-like chemotaxis protein
MAKKIMIVDDVRGDLEMMKTFLIREGYEVYVSGDGAEALDLLDSNKPDLILIDVKMPTLSGYDLLRLLRGRLDGKSKMAYVTIVPKEEVNMDDVDGFIQKPFSQEVFIAEVKRVLGEGSNA